MRNDLLAFDESVSEVIEVPSLDDLIKLEAVCLEEPEGHVTLPVFDGKRQAVFRVLVLLERVATVLVDQVLRDVNVARVRR